MRDVFHGSRARGLAVILKNQTQSKFCALFIVQMSVPRGGISPDIDEAYFISISLEMFRWGETMQSTVIQSLNWHDQHGCCRRKTKRQIPAAFSSQTSGEAHLLPYPQARELLPS